jgi:hypothetical protein
MLAKSVIKTHRAIFNSNIRYHLLDHHKMEEMKKKLFTDREKTFLLKAKFFLK